MATESTRFKVRKLTSQQAVKLLARFYRECGPAETNAAFGWDRPVEQLARDETCYEFRIPVGGPAFAEAGERQRYEVVGFGTIELDVRDARDVEAGLVMGVFPAHRRQGYWRAIVEWLVREAGSLGADVCTQMVFKGNADHCARVLRDALDDKSAWVHAGTAWFPPPGYEYFVCPITESESDA